MENKELIESFLSFKQDKEIDNETVMSFLEEAFRKMLIKRYGTDENFYFIIDPDKGDFQIRRERVVVEDDQVQDHDREIALSKAKEIEADFEIGEMVSEDYKLKNLSRKEVMTIGQELRQKVYEYENEAVYQKFKDILGKLYKAEVHHIRGKSVFLIDAEGNEILLPRDKQISSDFFKKGQMVRAIVENVELKGSKPTIIISRTSPKFLEKLLEAEIPEIEDELITIHKVVRIPGEKAKVAVESYSDKIDPVGSCVGEKGVRIRRIVKELGGENIDVIPFSQEKDKFITNAMTPAKIEKLFINEEKKRVEVFLKPEEVSKAIGKGGTNIRLAGLLTGYEIDVFREGMEGDIELKEFDDEIEQWVIREFERVGLNTAKSVLELSVEELVERVDLEEEMIRDVISLLREEMEEETEEEDDEAEKEIDDEVEEMGDEQDGQMEEN